LRSSITSFFRTSTTCISVDINQFYSTNAPAATLDLVNDIHMLD
jgi:hypothetical protein